MTNGGAPASTTSRPSMAPKILLGVIVLGVVIAIGVFGFRRMTDAGLAGTESETQKAEIDQCKKNMAEFYAAWVRYAKDHKGHEPQQYTDLVPKYISDPDKLVCPTAKRWMSKHVNMAAGFITLTGKPYPVTYGFRAFSASYQIQLRQKGDRTVLVACDAHREGLYRAVYHRGPPLNAFDPDQRAGLNDAVRDMKTIELHKNGVVDMQAEDP